MLWNALHGKRPKEHSISSLRMQFSAIVQTHIKMVGKKNGNDLIAHSCSLLLLPFLDLHPSSHGVELIDISALFPNSHTGVTFLPFSTLEIIKVFFSNGVLKCSLYIQLAWPWNNLCVCGAHKILDWKQFLLC